MKIKLWDKAEKELLKITKGNKNIASNIINTIEKFAEDSRGSYDVKILKGRFENLKRLRIGNYRVIYDIIPSFLVILTRFSGNIIHE